MYSRTIGWNLLANLLGQGWATVLALLAVPIFLHFLGADGFGLIGFYMTMATLLSVMDGGMAASATREAATLSAVGEDARGVLRETLRSIETLFALIAVSTGTAYALLAPAIAKHWLQVPEARMPEMTQALSLMGGALALQFMQGFYNSCLVGLQRQVLLNGVNAVLGTLRIGGAALVIWLWSPTASTFFAWQFAIGLLSAACMCWVTWNALGGAHGARPRLGALRRSGHFTMGVGATNLLGLILTQLDKVILSKLLPLQTYGYYMVAWTAGTLALRAAGPVFNAYYPALTSLAHISGSTSRIRHAYIEGSSLLSIAVAPITAFLVLFGSPLLHFWTGDATLANAAALPLAMIALGTMANACMHLPYALQLAHGRTRLPLIQNVIAVVLLPAITYFSTVHYGLTGASVSWLTLNLGYILFTPSLALRGLIDNAAGIWYWRCIVIPLAISIAISAIGHAIAKQVPGNLPTIAIGVASLLLSLVACTRFSHVAPWRLLFGLKGSETAP